MTRMRTAMYLLGATGAWEAVDYLFGCRVKWICERYEAHLTKPLPDGGATRPVYRVAVEIPAHVTPAVDTDALFTAVADAVYDWEPDERDGWDTDVYAGTVDVPDDEEPA